MKKILTTIAFFTILAVAGGYYFGKTIPKIPPPADSRAHQITVSPTAIPQAAEKPAANPMEIVIPKLNVKAQIESVGLDSERKMDVPQLAQNVAWYNLGVRPGEKGNAVIAGHLDTITGEPAVFHNLSSLSPGDTIHVTTKSSQTYSYKVTDIKTYEANSFPLKEVFGPTDMHRLNLITCSGRFDNASYNYSHRTVVYSQLISN